MFNNSSLNQGLAQGMPTTIGTVTDNCDPENLYRVKVKFLLMEGEDQSHWCRVATMGASAGGMGVHFLPEVGDEVVVLFLNGDPQHGVVMGTMWNGKNKPSYGNKAGTSQTGRFAGNSFKRTADAEKNDIRSISTRKGHELIFNDNASKPSVMLHSGQKHRIVLNDEGNEPTKIEIYDGKEENFIEINTKEKKITLTSATGDIILKAKNNIKIEAETGNIEMKSGKDTKVDAQSNIAMEAKSNASLNSTSNTKISSSGPVDIKGSVVNIN